MAVMRLFSGGAARLSIAIQNSRPPAILRCASALAHPKKYYFLGTPSGGCSLPAVGQRDAHEGRAKCPVPRPQGLTP